MVNKSIGGGVLTRPSEAAERRLPAADAGAAGKLHRSNLM